MRPEGPHRVADWTRYGPTDNQTILRALPNDLQTIISKLTLCPLGVFGALTRGPKRCLILPILWVIRWQDRETRDVAWKALRASPEWKAILAKVPGGWRSYLRTEARFATEI